MSGMSRAPIVACAFFLFSIVLSGASHAFSVDDYLSEVAHSHEGYQSAREAAEGSLAAAKASDLFFKPQVFANLQFTYDPRDTFSTELYGDRTLGKLASVGLRDQTPWGIQLQLSMDYSQNMLLGTSSPLIDRPTVTNLYPVPIFRWSLWQNWGGRMDRANQQVNRSQSLAESYDSDFQARVALVEAEGRYWKLAILREAIQLTKDSLARARSVMSLDRKKAQKQLIDPSDALLSEAAVQGKELELKSIVSEAKSAARDFNAARGIDSDEVRESLVLPKPEAFYDWKLPERPTAVRGDLKALEQQEQAAKAGYQVAKEKLLPDLSFFGSIFAAGISFSMPLDLGTTGDARDGYARKIHAAELDYHHKAFEHEMEWKDLKTRFHDLVERLKLAVRLEDLQRRKFEDMRKKRDYGRSVAFQVFQYELDYLTTEQNRLQLQGQLLGLRAQSKLYLGTEGER